MENNEGPLPKQEGTSAWRKLHPKEAKRGEDFFNEVRQSVKEPRTSQAEVVSVLRQILDSIEDLKDAVLEEGVVDKNPDDTAYTDESNQQKEEKEIQVEKATLDKGEEKSEHEGFELPSLGTVGWIAAIAGLIVAGLTSQKGRDLFARIFQPLWDALLSGLKAAGLWLWDKIKDLLSGIGTWIANGFKWLWAEFLKLPIIKQISDGVSVLMAKLGTLIRRVEGFLGIGSGREYDKEGNAVLTKTDWLNPKTWFGARPLNKEQAMRQQAIEEAIDAGDIKDEGTNKKNEQAYLDFLKLKARQENKSDKDIPKPVFGATVAKEQTQVTPGVNTKETYTKEVTLTDEQKKVLEFYNALVKEGFDSKTALSVAVASVRESIAKGNPVSTSTLISDNNKSQYKSYLSYKDLTHNATTQAKFLKENFSSNINAVSAKTKDKSSIEQMNVISKEIFDRDVRTDKEKLDTDDLLKSVKELLKDKKVQPAKIDKAVGLGSVLVPETKGSKEDAKLAQPQISNQSAAEKTKIMPASPLPSMVEQPDKSALVQNNNKDSIEKNSQVVTNNTTIIKQTELNKSFIGYSN